MAMTYLKAPQPRGVSSALSELDVMSIPNCLRAEAILIMCVNQVHSRKLANANLVEQVF